MVAGSVVSAIWLWLLISHVCSLSGSPRTPDDATTNDGTSDIEWLDYFHQNHEFSREQRQPIASTTESVIETLNKLRQSTSAAAAMTVTTLTSTTEGSTGLVLLDDDVEMTTMSDGEATTITTLSEASEFATTMISACNHAQATTITSLTPATLVSASSATPTTTLTASSATATPTTPASSATAKSTTTASSATPTTTATASSATPTTTESSTKPNATVGPNVQLTFPGPAPADPGLKLLQKESRQTNGSNSDFWVTSSIAAGALLTVILIATLLTVCLYKRSRHRKNVYATMEEDGPKEFTKAGPPVILQDEISNLAQPSRFVYHAKPDKVTEL